MKLNEFLVLYMTIRRCDNLLSLCRNCTKAMGYWSHYNLYIEAALCYVHIILSINHVRTYSYFCLYVVPTL